MKILDYNPIFGTFSAGFETFDCNEVVEVVKLQKSAEYGYNRIHKQWFLHDFNHLDDFSPQYDFDLAIFNPDVGGKLGRRGKINFYFNDFESCLQLLKREKPKFAIFTMDSAAVELLNTSKHYVRDGFGQVSCDILIKRLQNLGYEAYMFALDEASYGIPLHKSFAFYIATPKGHHFNVPKGFFTRYGRGNYLKYRTIADAIGDLGHTGEWVPYTSKPQNAYQKHIRRGMEKITWHFGGRMLKDTQKETIACIPQGSNASKTGQVKQRMGYNRPKWHSTPTYMDDKFYLTSSKGASIHPLYDRPFTFREAMRIHGLPDNLSFDLKTPRKELAQMIDDSIAPAIGEIFAIALGAI